MPKREPAAEAADENADIAVILPAAGQSVRMGAGMRKPFLELGGESILLRTIRRMAAAPGVFEIILAVHPDDLDAVQGEWWEKLSAAGATLAVAGGASRAESIWNAIQVVSARAEVMAVHDAVRPFVSLDIFKALISTARRCGAAVPVVPLVDTPKRIEGDRVIETPRRIGLMRVQTPQVFSSDLLIEAYEYALRTGGLSENITDDSQMVENLGREVAAVYGDEFNIKITTGNDLRMAEAFLAAGLVK